jgi:hypothetical protein
MPSRRLRILQYTLADIKAQLDTLPILFRVWFGWLGMVVLVFPFVLIGHRQGKVASLFAGVFIPLLLILIHFTGINYLISFLHLVLWIPLIFYLCWELKMGRIKPFSLIGIWSFVAISTLNISLVFDIRDAVRWLMGERGIIDPQPGIYLPWITIPGMLAGFLFATWYIFGSSTSN